VSERTADRLALAACLATLLLALVLGVMHRIGSFTLETDFYNWYAPQTVGLLLEATTKRAPKRPTPDSNQGGRKGPRH
jgi:hypothetical protein